MAGVEIIIIIISGNCSALGDKQMRITPGSQDANYKCAFKYKVYLFCTLLYVNQAYLFNVSLS